MADFTSGAGYGVSDEVRAPAHDAVGAYVVDALEPMERAEFEAHLRDCGQCRDDLVEFRETTVELTRIVAARPPGAVRAAVLQELPGIEREPSLEPADTDPPTVAPLDEHPSIMPWDLPSRSASEPTATGR